MYGSKDNEIMNTMAVYKLMIHFQSRNVYATVSFTLWEIDVRAYYPRLLNLGYYSQGIRYLLKLFSPLVVMGFTHFARDWGSLAINEFQRALDIYVFVKDYDVEYKRCDNIVPQMVCVCHDVATAMKRFPHNSSLFQGNLPDKAENDDFF